jgi:hypothetical protein
MPAKPRRGHVTRAEFDRLKTEVRRLADVLAANAEIIRANRHDHEVQFQRTAQLQAELDSMKGQGRKIGN